MLLLVSCLPFYLSTELRSRKESCTGKLALLVYLQVFSEADAVRQITYIAAIKIDVEENSCFYYQALSKLLLSWWSFLKTMRSK